MLDIGGGVGALVLHVPAELVGEEIELEPHAAEGARTHSAVRERSVEPPVFAAVYPALAAGRYRIGGSDQTVDVIGGRVVEAQYGPDLAKEAQPRDAV